MTDTVKKMDLDNTMLAYLFDPDDGLAEEIVSALNTMAKMCEQLEASAVNWPSDKARLEVAEAQLVFYTEVWQKINAATPSAEVVAEDIQTKSPYHFSAESDLLSDIGLHVFLVSVKQREGEAIMSYEARKGLAQDLLSRGWHKDVR